MNGYERILKVMRSQAKKNAEQGVRLGTVLAGGVIEVGQLKLEREDCLFAQHLVTGYIAADGSEVGSLSEGDTVVVKRLSPEIYAVIERVVENA